MATVHYLVSSTNLTTLYVAIQRHAVKYTGWPQKVTRLYILQLRISCSVSKNMYQNYESWSTVDKVAAVIIISLLFLGPPVVIVS